MKKSTAKPAEKYLTEKSFEKAMFSIAKSFQKIDDRFGTIEKTMGEMVEVMQAIQEDNREFKHRLIENDITLFGHDKKIQNLIVRVEKLEAKVK